MVITNIDTEKLFIVFDTREVNEPRLERIAVSFWLISSDGERLNQKSA